MSRRRLAIPLAAGIVVFWLVMMGLLFQREVFIERASPGPRGAESYDTWMAVYGGDSEDSRLGFVHSEARPERRNGIDGTSYSVTVKLAMVVLNSPAEIFVTGTAWNSLAPGHGSFDFKIRDARHSMRVSGAREAGRLDLQIDTAGESFPLSFPVNKNLMLSGNMGTTNMNLPYLEVGDEVLVDAFDPMTLSQGTARIRCVDTARITVMGRPVDTRVVKVLHGGIETTFWVAGDEEIVRIQTPFGFTFRKTSQDEALAALEPGDAQDLLQRLAIRPTGKTPFRGASRSLLRLSNLPEEALPPSDALQEARGGGVYAIRRPETPVNEFPPEQLSRYLEGDPFVQVESERIQAQANAIVDSDTDRWTQAMALYTWVYENIEKTIVLSFPSALEVLETREGDCNEHTVLYTALARAVGIPTRIAIGVVWSDALKGFYYHAWPEVYVDAWIPMDPTLGQPLADATHVKLLNGSIEKWPQLVPYLGQLAIEVLEVE